MGLYNNFYHVCWLIIWVDGYQRLVVFVDLSMLG